MVFKTGPTSGESSSPPSMVGPGLCPRPLLRRDSLPARRPFYNPRLIDKAGNRLSHWEIGINEDDPTVENRGWGCSSIPDCRIAAGPAGPAGAAGAAGAAQE
ncbi:MAG: hypothetical protein GY904_18420 [Planctomycetaceae bacterium]|nr:hypothetical protein [Planctomycetaceae bacterium]